MRHKENKTSAPISIKPIGPDRLLGPGCQSSTTRCMPGAFNPSPLPFWTNIHFLRQALIACLTIFMFLGCTHQNRPHLPGKPYHHTESGFRNPPGSIEKAFSWDAFWFFPSRPFAQLWNPEIPEGHVVAQKEAIHRWNALGDRNKLVWIGHMTVLIQLDGQIIMIDPWLTKYATPIPPFGPHRKIQPGIALDELPQIDTIVISHNHYDHLSVETLEIIPHPEKITVILPLRVKQYIEHIQFKEIIEVDWYDSVQRSNVTFTALPVVHFSGRGLWDRNETLWAGFTMEGLTSGKKLFYMEGDYGDIYKKIGKKYGPFDILMIASAPTEPESLMKGSHCRIDMCVQIGIDLGAEKMIPIHWGTMILGSDDLYGTGQKFKAAALRKGVKEKNLWILPIGDTIAF